MNQTNDKTVEWAENFYKDATFIRSIYDEDTVYAITPDSTFSINDNTNDILCIVDDVCFIVFDAEYNKIAQILSPDDLLKDCTLEADLGQKVTDLIVELIEQHKNDVISSTNSESDDFHEALEVVSNYLFGENLTEVEIGDDFMIIKTLDVKDVTDVEDVVKKASYDFFMTAIKRDLPNATDNELKELFMYFDNCDNDSFNDLFVSISQREEPNKCCGLDSCDDCINPEAIIIDFLMPQKKSDSPNGE